MKSLSSSNHIIGFVFKGIFIRDSLVARNIVVWETLRVKMLVLETMPGLPTSYILGQMDYVHFNLYRG